MASPLQKESLAARLREHEELWKSSQIVALRQALEFRGERYIERGGCTYNAEEEGCAGEYIQECSAITHAFGDLGRSFESGSVAASEG